MVRLDRNGYKIKRHVNQLRSTECEQEEDHDQLAEKNYKPEKPSKRVTFAESEPEAVPPEIFKTIGQHQPREENQCVPGTSSATMPVWKSERPRRPVV